MGVQKGRGLDQVWASSGAWMLRHQGGAMLAGLLDWDTTLMGEPSSPGQHVRSLLLGWGKSLLSHSAASS